MKETIQTVSNHPVQMYDKDGKLSPSAFIPFCDFGGGNMSLLGDMMEPFELPVCKSFKPKVRNDQLCYEVDLDEFKDRNNIENDLRYGLVFFMDYNEDRQVTIDDISDVVPRPKFVDKVDASKDDEKAFIYLNAIGISKLS